MRYTRDVDMRYHLKGLYMARDIKKLEVRILLQDYLNYLPPGQQEAYVPAGTMGNTEDTWPLTSEALKRMDKNSYVGQTYEALDQALDRLMKEYPGLYNAIQRIYLDDFTGHSELDFQIKNAPSSTFAFDLVLRHNQAIDKLAEWLDDVDLFVVFPQMARGASGSDTMEERHNELYATYKRYIDQGFKHSDAVKNARLKLSDSQGATYSKSQAYRIIKARLDSEDDS